MKRISWGLLALMVLVSGVSGEKVEGSGFRAFPRCYGTGTLYYFLNHRDDMREERFVAGGGLTLECVALAKDDRFLLIMDVDLLSGTGDSVAANLPFSPMEVSYGLGLFFEYLWGRCLLRAGWDHTCDHVVFKDHPDPWYEVAGVETDVFYNRPFVGVGSQTMRPQEQRRVYLGGRTKGERVSPLIWYAELGYYMRSAFGARNDDVLFNGNDWTWDAKVNLGLVAWRCDRIAVLLSNRAHLLLDTDGKTFWRDTAELSVLLGKGEAGLSFYAGSHLVDDHPRDGKEEMWEIGARLVY